MWRALLAAFALASPAGAQGEAALSVEVGATIEQDVGNAIGWFCDDPSLVDATLVTRGDVNYWVVTGVKPGATKCQVGTSFGRAQFVFDVTVEEPSSNRR